MNTGDNVMKVGSPPIGDEFEGPKGVLITFNFLITEC